MGNANNAGGSMKDTAVCPDWCNDHSEGELGQAFHRRTWGDEHGASVTFWLLVDRDGSRVDSGYSFNVNEAEHPDDMLEVAAWCQQAAALGAEVLELAVAAR